MYALQKNTFVMYNIMVLFLGIYVHVCIVNRFSSVQIRLLMEGLFSHFFSADRRGYHEEDMRWFLELANQQDDWCVPHVSDIVIGGTSEQDLLDELQKSIYEKEKSRTATLTVEVCVILFKVHPVFIQIAFVQVKTQANPRN